MNVLFGRLSPCPYDEGEQERQRVGEPCSGIGDDGFLVHISFQSKMSVYPTILVGLVSARDENLLVILDLDDVLPVAGETVGTDSLVEDEYVEVTVNRPFGI